MELNREQIVKALDVLYKMDFFQGQRAGRELWFKKPFEVQEQDIAEFSQGIVFVKNIITNALALIREQAEDNERLRAELDRTEKALIASDKAHNALFTDTFRIEADTVRKYREKLYRELASLGVKDKFNKEFFLTKADQVAKDLLEEGK